MNKKVSIIIPIYNVERYIDQCVKCVLDQSYVFTEVILSDDGSTDSSGAICDDWAKKDKRIKVIHDENRGASMARNRGIDLATGNYIIFLDSDDYWEGENVLAEMMAQLEQSDADMLVFGYSKLFEPQGTIKAITPIGKRSEVVGKPKSEAFDYLTTLNIHVASPGARICKTELIKDKLYFEPDVTAEDIEWTARMILAVKRLDYYPKDLYIYRQRAGSVTKTMTKNNVVQLQRAIGKCIDHGKAIENDAFYPHYMGYVAYQYITSLANAYKLNKSDLRGVYDKLVEQSWLLTYGKNRRVKMIALAKKLLGFRLMFAVLRLYYKRLKR